MANNSSGGIVRAAWGPHDLGYQVFPSPNLSKKERRRIWMFFNPAPSSGSDSSYNLLFKLIKIRIGFPSNSIYEDIRVKVAFGDLRNI